MAELPNIFFIIGAPTSKTFEDFEDFIVDNGKENVKLVICADMPTYINALKGANVFKTPTNFRAHADDVRTFYIGNNETITTDSEKNFKKLQEDIATSLYNIFKLAHGEKIPTYFGIVKRENRPTWLNKTKWVNVEGDEKLKEKFEERKESGKGKMKTWFEYKDGTKIIPHPDSVQNESKETFLCEYSPPYKANYFDEDLTRKIRDNLLIPIVYNEDGEGNGKEKLHEIINNPKISKYGATFLSDMITVACADLIDNKDLWDSYTPIFGSPKTNNAKYFENKHSLFGDMDDVAQENLNFCNITNIKPLNDKSTFFGYKENEKAIEELKKKMHTMIDNNDKIFGNCYVWHDDELNDLDDLPAIGLIKKLSKDEDKVQENINYNKNKEELAKQDKLTDEIKALRKAKAEGGEAAKVGEGGRRRSKSGKKKRTKKKNKKNTKKRRSRKNKKRRR